MDIALSSLQTTRTKCIVEGEAKNPEIKSNKKISCIYLSVAEGNYLYCPGGSLVPDSMFFDLLETV